jgi:dTDP-4-amino-4,6-dideoxygalactose transaminase
MKIFVTKPYLPPIEEYICKIREIWDNSLLTNMGPMHVDLERKLMQYLKVPNLNLFTNGHMALDIAIKALGLQPGGEVITTPFTFVSTTHCIVANGLTPVFCDIKPNDYTINENIIESLITEKTVAIVPVHVYGYPCNVEAISKIARKYNLKVIYDAAHAFGVAKDGISIGNFGDVSMFSFHATKLFHTIEGGALSFNDSKYKDKFNMHKNFGISGPETVELVGSNAKMNEFQAAMGIVNLEHIDEITEKRKKITEQYRNRLKDISGIILTEDMPNIIYNYSYFPVLIDEDCFGKTRDELFEILQNEEIYARKYFYPIITELDCYKGIYGDQRCPVAMEIAQKVITLPLYPQLSTSDVDKICDVIKNAKTSK